MSALIRLLRDAANRIRCRCPAVDPDDDIDPVVLTEDDIEALYADWCRDGRGFGEDQL